MAREFTKRDLFGGAITAEIPEFFVDARYVLIKKKINLRPK